MLPVSTEQHYPLTSNSKSNKPILLVRNSAPTHNNYHLTADERMDRMMALYHILIEKAPPVFPPPGLKTSEGFNFNLIEDILCGIQARLCLYLICQFTGRLPRFLPI